MPSFPSDHAWDFTALVEVNNVPVSSGHGNNTGIASEKRGKHSLISPVLTTCSTGGAITLINTVQ